MSNSVSLYSKSDVDKLASCHQENEQVLRQLYRRSDAFQQQLEDIWYNRWIYVCQSTEVPHAGDYVAVNIGDYPVVIVRNNTGEINALNNSCRHRGSRICQKNRGNGPNLVCPYHQWTYDLDGKLAYARDMMQEINIQALPLKSFAISIVNDSIYVNVKLASGSSELSPYKCLSVKKRHRAAYEYRVSCNIGYEAALEMYNLSSTLDDNQEDASANVRFYHDPETDGIIAVCIMPLDENNTELKLTYMVTSGTSEGTHFSRSDFIHQAKQQLGIAIVAEDINNLSTTPVRSVSPEDVPAIQARHAQEELTERQAIDHNDIYASYRLWDAEKQDLVCTMIVRETEDVKTFTFQTSDGSWFNYKPGQFITLQLPTPGQPTLRTYTLASSPSRPVSISVTVKAQPDSIGTRWLFDNVKVGDTLKAYGPNGDFTFFNDPADKYLFISAGSGITPMMSMTRWMFDYGGNMDINFIGCVKSPNDILFKDELERMARRSNDIRLSWVCAHDDELNSWTGYRGRFNKLILGLTSPDYLERDVYCCGPAPFMRAVREILHDAGYDMERYHEESFGGPNEGMLREDDEFPTEGVTSTINFKQSGKSVECSQSMTLLEAAKKSSIAIPSACGIGVCGTCKVKVNAGETLMVHSGGIGKKDEEAGYVLACCTRPLSDVDIDI